jgi:hypothetical protein
MRSSKALEKSNAHAASDLAIYFILDNRPQTKITIVTALRLLSKLMRGMSLHKLCLSIGTTLGLI